MTTLNELKKRYGTMRLDEIEKDAKQAQNTSISSRREFIEALYYIRHENRFRESKLFEKSDFATYLKSTFMMSEAEYNKERIAYISFPDQAQRFGPGVVAKALNKCGHVGAGKMFKALPSNSRIETVEKAIDAHAKPVKEKAALPGHNTKANIESMRKKLADARDLIIEKDRIIAEQSRQIMRLKNTVLRLKAELEDKETVNRTSAWSPDRVGGGLGLHSDPIM